MNKRAITDITNFIFVSDIPKKSDIIFLPGSSKWEISERAAELYKMGLARYVMPAGKYSSSLGYFPYETITNEKYKGIYNTDHEYCSSILRYNGVPEKAIICEKESMDTLENARNSAELLGKKSMNITSAILCCQAFHSCRALMTYMRFFPKVEFYVVPVDTQGITKDNWYKNESSYRKILGEVEKCGRYFADAYTANA